MTSLALREARFVPITQIVRRRLLPTAGRVVVKVGDRVQPDDIVAQATVVGQLAVLDLASALGVSAEAAERFVQVAPGTQVEAGALLASRRSLWRGHREVRAPLSGVAERVEDGYLFVRQQPQPYHLRAALPGVVVEQYPHRGVAIAATGALVRGIWGSGHEHQGILATMVASPAEELTWERVGLRYRGTIIVGGILEDPRVLLRARQFRLVGIVVGSMLPNLHSLCQRLGLAVMVTEGMGRIPMAEPVFELLRACHGRTAMLAGPESPGGMGPELIVPLPAEADENPVNVAVQPVQVGTRVRLTRAPYVGVVGEVVTLPSAPQETVLGTHAEGALVRLPEGRRVFVPLVNMEPLG
ncbi:MAG: hypothetical protein V1772_02510 [Chloroflexota bacterium]